MSLRLRARVNVVGRTLRDEGGGELNEAAEDGVRELRVGGDLQLFRGEVEVAGEPGGVSEGEADQVPDVEEEGKVVPRGRD